MTFDTGVFIAIVTAYALIVVSPGPNFVLVTRYALRQSAPHAFAVTLALACSGTVLGVLTIVGLGAVILAFPAIGALIAAGGGAFLGYLGLSAISTALRERDAINPRTGDPSNDLAVASEKSLSEAFSTGLFVSMLNPKAYVFFVSLYAPLTAQASSLTKGAVLTTGFGIEVLWYGAVSLLLARSEFRQVNRRAGFWIDLVSGSSLILLAIRIIATAPGYLAAM